MTLSRVFSTRVEPKFKITLERMLVLADCWWERRPHSAKSNLISLGAIWASFIFSGLQNKFFLIRVQFLLLLVFSVFHKHCEVQIFVHFSHSNPVHLTSGQKRFPLPFNLFWNATQNCILEKSATKPVSNDKKAADWKENCPQKRRGDQGDQRSRVLQGR